MSAQPAAVPRRRNLAPTYEILDLDPPSSDAPPSCRQWVVCSTQTEGPISLDFCSEDSAVARPHSSLISTSIHSEKVRRYPPPPPPPLPRPASSSTSSLHHRPSRLPPLEGAKETAVGPSSPQQRDTVEGGTGGMPISSSGSASHPPSLSMVSSAAEPSPWSDGTTRDVYHAALHRRSSQLPEGTGEAEDGSGVLASLLLLSQQQEEREGAEAAADPNHNR